MPILESPTMREYTTWYVKTYHGPATQILKRSGTDRFHGFAEVWNEVADVCRFECFEAYNAPNPVCEGYCILPDDTKEQQAATLRAQKLMVLFVVNLVRIESCQVLP